MTNVLYMILGFEKFVLRGEVAIFLLVGNSQLAAVLVNSFLQSKHNYSTDVVNHIYNNVA
ncbi:hypothetical protein NIES4103_66990 [Nostoc sp. NIES-4103]|nr:hypothetical protein NIES4103_66990 [Nostoc sp. NIES-4103]